MLLALRVAWGEVPPMASPGQLITAMAEMLGLLEITVTHHDRFLVTAGLRTKGGRGRSAPQVTARDAATLLVTILASAQLRDSVHTVERYAASRLRHAATSQDDFGALGLPELAALSEDSSFIDAVEVLILTVTSGSLRAAIGSDAVEAASLAPIAPLIEVTAQTPGTIGEIRVSGLGNRTASAIYGLPEPFGTGVPPPSMLKAWERQVGQYRHDTDLTQQRRVSGNTIVRLGELLATEQKD